MKSQQQFRRYTMRHYRISRSVGIECCNKHAHLIFLDVKPLYRKQRKRLPPMPQTRAEVTLAGDWANTLGDEPFTWHLVKPSPSCRSWVSVHGWNIPNLPMSLLSDLLDPHHKIWPVWCMPSSLTNSRQPITAHSWRSQRGGEEKEVGERGKSSDDHVTIALSIIAQLHLHVSTKRKLHAMRSRCDGRPAPA